LFLIDEILKIEYNKALANILEMLQSIIPWQLYHPNPLIVEQCNWNQDDLMSIISDHIPKLNVEETEVIKKS